MQASLGLFGEAIAGSAIGFARAESPVECWPWTVTAPGQRHVLLPPQAELHDDAHVIGVRYRRLCRTIILHRMLTAAAPDAVEGSRHVAFEYVYALVEDLRVSAQIRSRYAGAAGDLAALHNVVASELSWSPSEAGLLRALRLRSLDGQPTGPVDLTAACAAIDRLTSSVVTTDASATDSVSAANAVCDLLQSVGAGLAELAGDIANHEDAPETPSQGTTGVSLDGGTPTEFEVSNGLGGGQLLSDSDGGTMTNREGGDQPTPGFDLAVAVTASNVDLDRRTYVYDEWDYHARLHRRDWCRVIEEPLVGDDHDFMNDVRQRHQALRSRMRRSLMKLRPQDLVRVYRSADGDELDIGAAIEAIADRRSGAPADDRLHVRRDRAARDVATAFLVDLSASTSSPAVPPEPEVVPDTDPMDDPMSYGPIWDAAPRLEPVRRVVDVAKDAVALMGDALNELGDQYAVYGFSGTGRDNVEFKIGKDFGDRVTSSTWASIAAMKPLRYTRMGPAVRHAAAKLGAQSARTKVLIIISDGYPQDSDYGRDRHDRDYGIHDTARALLDATAAGIETFCVTIDPAGHDYLRQMCPDHRYLVINDVESLPEELAKLYLLKWAN